MVICHPRGRGLPRSVALLVGACLAMAGVGASALEALPEYGAVQVVPDEVLAEQRGGFYGRDGLQVAIGLEQATYLNGEAVHRSVLRELSPLSRENPLPREIMEQVVIRSGTNGADIQRQLSDHGWVTTIQNDLDGQSIEHQITLDIELHNVRIPRSDLGRALERQLIESASHY